MVVSLSTVLLLGAVVFVLCRYAGLRPWHGAICALFGFYLASTGAAPTSATPRRQSRAGCPESTCEWSH